MSTWCVRVCVCVCVREREREREKERETDRQTDLFSRPDKSDADAISKLFGRSPVIHMTDTQ